MSRLKIFSFYMPTTRGMNKEILGVSALVRTYIYIMLSAPPPPASDLVPRSICRTSQADTDINLSSCPPLWKF
jgi:hypothetical protein